MNLSLEGKNALVCGGSEGIGLATAIELAIMGANCILVSRSADKLHDAKLELDDSLRQQHRTVALDLSDLEAVKKFAGSISKEINIHIIVNNSGGPPAGALLTAPDEQFLKYFTQHVVVAQTFAAAFLEGMKVDHYGRIINIVSTSVRTPLKNLGVSNTVRGAMASWAKSLANEIGVHGITVNNVLPGFTSTARLESLIAHTARETGVDVNKLAEQMRKEVPLQRFADASEVAAMAAFLASPAAAYITGTSTPVDGGRTPSI